LGEALGDLKRTCYCGDVGPERIGQEVTLMGWVNRRRDLGGLVFIDLRDRSGIVQVVFNPEFNPKTHEKASSLRNEYVIAVKGKVIERPKGTENPDLFVVALRLVTSTFNLRNRAEEVKVIDFVAEIKIAWPNRNFRDHNEILTSLLCRSKCGDGEGEVTGAGSQ
jgi:aspartyl-tRNA synthetase